MADPKASGRVSALPNSIYVVETRAGSVLVNSPPETLKYLLSYGHRPPRTIVLAPDIPAGQELGSSGFVRRGINYASVEFLLYSNFFVNAERTHIITVTASQAERIERILAETLVGPPTPDDYGDFPWLIAECTAASYFPPFDRAPVPADLALVTSLEQDGGDLGQGVQVRFDGSDFIFSEAASGQDPATDPAATVAVVPGTIRDQARPLALAPARPLLRHELSLQFIGGSDGFDPDGITTCFLAYLGHDRATLFDAAAYLRLRLGNLGLSLRHISEVVLSHLHEDHMAGLPELLLMGEQRVRLLTADIIYQSLLRVLSAIFDLPASEVAAMFDYIPLNPGKPVTLEGRRFEATYALHTIPTIAVRVDDLFYSGDMRYDEAWFDELVSQGVLTESRRDELLNSGADARVIVQDAGGGTVHTTVTPDVLKALAAKGQRVILAHTRDQVLPREARDLAQQIEFASSGHISNIGPRVSANEEDERIATFTASPLYARLPADERALLARYAALTAFADGATIIQDGAPADGWTYLVHSGLVEIRQPDQMPVVAGRGSSIGERGALRGGRRANTIVARGPVTLLGLKESLFSPVSSFLQLPAAMERADWLWRQPLFKDLLWSNLLDLALDFQPRQLKKGEQLFRYGEPGFQAYLLVRGLIVVVDKDDWVLEELKPGSFFGGRAVLYNDLRNATAYALTPTEVWQLPASALQRYRMVYPNIHFYLRAVEADRLGELDPDEEPRQLKLS